MNARDLSITEKRNIIQQAIHNLSAQLFDLEIAYSVNKKCDDKEGIERIKKLMETVEKKIRLYEEEAKAIPEAETPAKE